MTRLSESQRLSLQQLRLLEWAERRAEPVPSTEADAAAPSAPRAPSRGEGWELTRGLDLAPWQQAACRAWFDGGGRGTIKVVTGAGKTVVALAIAERLQRQERELRVAIVVPTIVLMSQWDGALPGHSTPAENAIPRLAGGHSDKFGADTAVLIAVLASARKE